MNASNGSSADSGEFFVADSRGHLEWHSTLEARMNGKKAGVTPTGELIVDERVGDDRGRRSNTEKNKKQKMTAAGKKEARARGASRGSNRHGLDSSLASYEPPPRA